MKKKRRNVDLDRYFMRKFKELGINVSISTKKEVNQVLKKIYQIIPI
jgi:hypothetical protein